MSAYVRSLMPIPRIRPAFQYLGVCIEHDWIGKKWKDKSRAQRECDRHNDAEHK